MQSRCNPDAIQMQSAPSGMVRAHVAVCEQPQCLRLPLLIGEHEEAVKLAGGGSVLDAPHVGKAHRERLQVLRLKVQHAADEQRTLRAARLELGVVAPELVAPDEGDNQRT